MDYIALNINGTPIPAPNGIPKGGAGTLSNALSGFLTILLVFGVLYALYTFIMGGIAWSASDGDKQKITQARLKIIYGIVGLVIILGSFFILNFFFSTLNVN